jgi:hypothetical protein
VALGVVALLGVYDGGASGGVVSSIKLGCWGRAGGEEDLRLVEVLSSPPHTAAVFFRSSLDIVTRLCALVCVWRLRAEQHLLSSYNCTLN